MAHAKLTAKQEAFALAYLENGNAAEAYRATYNCERMNVGTVQREATRLMANPLVTTRIEQLRKSAADKAVLNRSWVLERLMRNAQVCLGEQNIKLRVQRKDKETGAIEVAEVEVSAHDPTAANRALELLGKTDEVRAFLDRVEATGKDGAPLLEQPSNRDLARAVLDIIRQAKIEGGTPAMTDDEETAKEVYGATMSAAPVSRASAFVAPTSPATVSRTPSDRLVSGENELLPNGAQIIYSPELKKWAVFDGVGHLHTYKRDLEEARSLAARIKPVAQEDMQ
jgi:phage terminase small subunit